MTESLEKTEMKMLMEEHSIEMAAQSPDPMMMQMPSSCQSILKVNSTFFLSDTSCYIFAMLFSMS